MSFTIGQSIRSAVAVAATGLLLLGCGERRPDPVSSADGEDGLGEAISLAMSDNGMSANGVSANGLSANGLSANGLSANGLTAASIGKATFATWFNVLPPVADMVMKYVVRCAAPAGRSYAFYSATTRRTYSWTGNLGVAPGWVSGRAITTAEQQLVSACLAAHVNKFGVQVAIAVEGNDANGVPLSWSGDELWQFDAREACFFGNLFTGEGIYAGIDHDFPWSEDMSSVRACAFDARSIGTTRDCPPIKMAGHCRQLCTPTADGLGYATCSYGGKTFKALATRIDSWGISYCADGWCDPQERCGTGWSWDSCGSDCGRCP